ncbi:hypothetical protein B0H14DRAFT_3440256 [Mycena olivaceomarginata]|nr:hypothetical protein B0H14DRAFT_3440256 [Mycena olivaceomarginata]
MYHSLCPPAYNEETTYLIDNDPQCQIVISTVAFTNGINARKLLDSTANPPKAPAKRRKAVMLKKPQARAPMKTVKAQFLIQKKCYYTFLNRHYEKPPLELSLTLHQIPLSRYLA